jgi:hypothetical protein
LKFSRATESLVYLSHEDLASARRIRDRANLLQVAHDQSIGHRPPRNSFLVENLRKHADRSLAREPESSAEELTGCDSFEIQEIELRMAPCDLDHLRHGGAGVGSTTRQQRRKAYRTSACLRFARPCSATSSTVTFFHPDETLLLYDQVRSAAVHHEEAPTVTQDRKIKSGRE